jgi:hypothetical protein
MLKFLLLYVIFSQLKKKQGKQAKGGPLRVFSKKEGFKFAEPVGEACRCNLLLARKFKILLLNQRLIIALRPHVITRGATCAK